MNMFQMKEQQQQKSRKRSPNATEISNLPDAVFREMVIELGRRMEELNENSMRTKS